MKTNRPTGGDWDADLDHVNAGGERTPRIIADNVRGTVAVAHLLPDAYLGGNGTARGNALLAAAAPRMLRALLAVTKGDDIMPEAMDIIEALVVAGVVSEREYVTA